MVVLDELHMVADSSRGCVIESLLSKITAARQHIRIVTMSATLANMDEIKQWLGDSSGDANYYETDYRPVKLAEFVCVDGKVKALSSKTKTLNDVRSLHLPGKQSCKPSAYEYLQLCKETVADGHGVICL